MSNLKDTKMANIIREFAAQYVNLESNRNSLITVTHVEIEQRGKIAKVYFTVLPDSEVESAQEFLQRRQSDFRKFLIDKRVFGFAPSIYFTFDKGEKNRQKIDELSQNL
jgi:ribosome-binding factor A